MAFVLLHIPHIIPALVAMGFLGRFAVVMADQPPVEFSDAQIEEWRRVRVERARERRVRGTSARLGLLALPLLILAIATGLWLYTVPLLITGAVLLFAPSSGSLTAYAHLVASAWWMTIFGIHLMRYLGRALGAALRGNAAPE